MNRRDFIRTVLVGSAALGWSAERVYAERQPGFNTSRRHVVREPAHMLRDGYLFDVPAPTEFKDLVIVGAGANSLFSAYHLPNVDLVCLEKESRAGGNAQRGMRNGIYMNEGAAYTDMNSELVEFMKKEFGITPMRIGGYDALVVGNAIVRNLYRDDFEGLPYSEDIRSQFRRFRDLVSSISKRLEDGASALFEEREVLDSAVREELLRLDSMDFDSWLKENQFPKEVVGWCEIYCPPQISSFPRNSSALVSILGMAGVSSYDEIGSWPGGLATMAEALAEGVRKQGHDRIRTGTFVVRVVNTSDEKAVDVTYLRYNKLFTIRCKTCIWGGHKNVARYAIPQMPERQKDAIGETEYLDISMINLCYDRTIYNGDFITWLDDAPIQNFGPADWVLSRGKASKTAPQILGCDWANRPEQRALLLDDEWIVEQCQRTARRLDEIFPGSIDHLEEIRVLLRAHSWVNYSPGYLSKVMPHVSQDIGRIVMTYSDHGSFREAMAAGIDNAKTAVGWLNK